MRCRYAGSILPVFVVLFVYLTVCAAPVAAAQAKTAKSVPVSKAMNSGDWEVLVKNAQKEGRVVIYGSGSASCSSMPMERIREPST